MKPKQEHSSQSPHFDRGARLLLAFVILFLLVDIAQVLYRYTLPTDGWSVNNNNSNDWIYVANLVGAPTGLLPGDVVQSVDGRPAQITRMLDFTTPPPNWQVGNTVILSVQRGRQLVNIPVPLGHWTPEAVWRLNFSDPVQVVNNLGVKNRW